MREFSLACQFLFGIFKAALHRGTLPLCPAWPPLDSLLRLLGRLSVMNWTRRFRALEIWILVCATVCVAGCGRNRTAPLSEGAEHSTVPPGTVPAEAPPHLQTEQKLTPLTQEDVALYLRVMHLAALRVKNRLPTDRAALVTAKQILDARDSGRTPTPDDARMLQHATLVATGMDELVAQEMKIDLQKYRGIADAVETVIPNPLLPPDPANQAVENSLTRLQRRLQKVDAANAKLLGPYRKEIQQLLAVVRNPANLPN